jgi:autotransporter-associated beta strand protein
MTRVSTLCQSAPRSSRLLAGVFAIAALAASACGRKAAEPQGQARVSVLALSAADVAKVNLTVSGPTFPQPKVYSLFNDGTAWGGLIGGLPAGSNALFLATAADSSGTVMYAGQASNVTIVAGTIVTVVITAQQMTAPTPFSNAVPVIDSLIVSATEVAPGDVVQLKATAHDPNAGDTITYAWSASEGALSSGSGTATTWSAPVVEGSYHADLKVTDNHGASAGTSVTIHVASGNGSGKAAVTVQLNTWPTVNEVTVSPAWVVLGQPTALAASASDTDGDPLTYAWTSTCTGTFSNASASPSFLLSGQPGTSSCTMTVTVSDGRGGSTSGDVTMPVGTPTVNQAPIIVSTVQSASLVDPNATVNLFVQAADPEGAALTFTWSDQTGTLSGQANTSSTSQVVWTAPASTSGDWRITVLVGDGSGGSTPYVFSITPVPAAPSDLGFLDSAPSADPTTVLPFIDFAYTNQRGDARYATLDTNAGVRVLSGFLTLWKPVTLFVDAGQTAPANGTFSAVTASPWTGIPGDSTDGTILNATVLNASIKYVVDATSTRTAAQELAAYLDDRRGKGYSVSDGMGPLTLAWRTATQQTTTIVDIPADATTKAYNDGGNNTGVGGSANTTFGVVVDFVNNIGENGSTEPPKRFYKYARPWRWTTDVKVVPALVPVESTTSATDGGFPSGHTAEAVRDALAYGYVVPERFQEMLCRAFELGEDRILAGMHSPLDVMGGRILGESVAAASLATGANSKVKSTAYAQAHTALMVAVNASTLAAFNDFAHSQSTASDRFADHAANKAAFVQHLTYGFAPIGDSTKSAVVPKGAEVLLETRFPYLDATQRRVVLKTTALPSGYPLLDDSEGWGRLNLFAAADGYGQFNGDVVVMMQASDGGFSALDSWKNDIGGAGKLTKKGTGTLELVGTNGYTGGTQIVGGTLRAASASALGSGDVYLSQGNLVATMPITVKGAYTQLASTELEVSVSDTQAAGLQVSGTATIMGGTFRVTLPKNWNGDGQTITGIRAQSLQGTFSAIQVDGYQVTPIYAAGELRLQLAR